MPNGEQGWLQKWWKDFSKLQIPTYGYQHWREPYYEQAGWQPQPRAVAPPPTALSYSEFSQLDPAEQERILRTPSGVGLPDVEGTGYRFEWGFTPETGQMWQLKKITEEEKEPWQTPAFPTTRQAGGYTFMPSYDAEGNIAEWLPVGRAPEAPEEAVEPEVIKEGLTSEELRSMSLEFDLWKSQVLQDPTLAGPAGWIRRYMIEQIQNPFGYEKQRAIHRRKVIRASEKEKEVASFAKEVEAKGGIYTPASTPGEAYVSPKEAASYAKWQRRATTRVGRREPTKPPTPTLPVAPATLAQFVPGLVPGQPITKQQVMTPSGQQWMATPWSQREQLRGYTEWAGGRPYQDILEQMAMMRPETPEGIARKAWKPARQWA